MEIEKKMHKQIITSEQTITQAKALIKAMAALKKKLHLSEGCGQRFLHKTHPEMAILQQAEQEIAAEYSGKTTAPVHSQKKTNLINNILRQDQA